MRRGDDTRALQLFFTSQYAYDTAKNIDQVRVGIYLFGGGARFSISDISDETGVLSMSGVVGPKSWWTTRGRSNAHHSGSTSRSGRHLIHSISIESSTGLASQCLRSWWRDYIGLIERDCWY